MPKKSGSDSNILAHVHYPPLQVSPPLDPPKYCFSLGIRKKQHVPTTKCASVETFGNENTEIEKLDA